MAEVSFNAKQANTAKGIRLFRGIAHGDGQPFRGQGTGG